MVSKEELEELKRQLVKFEGVVSAQQQVMKETVGAEVGRVGIGLRELYDKADEALKAVNMRLDKLENEDHKGDQNRSLINPKHLTIATLDKQDEWRKWKADVEDYAEETMSGIKKYLDIAREADEEVELLTLGDEKWWNKAEMIWRFLRKYSDGDAKKIVSSVRMRNGWEAWRKLHQQYEPGMVMREAMVMAQFTNMVSKRAKNPKETKAILVELEERAKKVEEITQNRVDDRHLMSVIMGILDTETLKHTAQYQGANANPETLKRKVMEFVNLMGCGGPGGGMDAMDLSRVEAKTMWADMEAEEFECNETNEEYHGLHGFGETCHNCGGYGHYVRECPTSSKGGKAAKGDPKGSKGKSIGEGGAAYYSPYKGKGKGQEKGGKGKGEHKGKGAPQAGCWTCGGTHYNRDCPQGGGKEGGKEGVRSLCSLQETHLRGDGTG